VEDITKKATQILAAILALLCVTSCGSTSVPTDETESPVSDTTVVETEPETEAETEPVLTPSNHEITAADVECTAEEIKQYVLDHMAKHKPPRYVVFVDSFPMNAAGKILKYKMREDAKKLPEFKEAANIVTA